MAVKNPVIQQVLEETGQSLRTRKHLYLRLERLMERPIISYFTSFKYPVMIDDADADMLEGVLQKIDLSRGFVLNISSPGGIGLASERIIRICRDYSGTKEFWAIVPGKAKSAATMICFGASKIIMGSTSELGPVDPQITIADDQGNVKQYSLWNMVKSYEDLFNRAVASNGNLQPYLQQLSNYDERDIKEYITAIDLSKDISIRSLSTGMMRGIPREEIENKIKVFLSPETTKAHGRPIYHDEASSCGLNIEHQDVKTSLWALVYELYIRVSRVVMTRATKVVESKDHEYVAALNLKGK